MNNLKSGSHDENEIDGQEEETKKKNEENKKPSFMSKLKNIFSKKKKKADLSNWKISSSDE